MSLPALSAAAAWTGLVPAAQALPGSAHPLPPAPPLVDPVEAGGGATGHGSTYHLAEKRMFLCPSAW